MKICILTAGKGTRMGVSSKQINKALLPIDHKAVISHIIEKFSIEDVFVIALGYKGDQVINYLKSAHPKNKFEFVKVENFDGEGSGPGLSLISCMENLQEPFLFFACDGLFFDEINNFDHNWIGISKIFNALSIILDRGPSRCLLGVAWGSSVCPWGRPRGPKTVPRWAQETPR